jgi:hypothetical protein
MEDYVITLLRALALIYVIWGFYNVYLHSPLEDLIDDVGYFLAPALYSLVSIVLILLMGWVLLFIFVPKLIM